jgi:hypothetical protein
VDLTSVKVIKILNTKDLLVIALVWRQPCLCVHL